MENIIYSLILGIPIISLAVVAISGALGARNTRHNYWEDVQDDPELDEPDEEEISRAADDEFKRRRSQVIDVLNSNELLAEELLSFAGYTNKGRYTAMRDEEVIAAIVRATYSDYILDILHVAGTQTDIDFRSVSSEESFDVGRVISDQPTNSVDFRSIESLQELSLVAPEELVLDDDIFYMKLFKDELMVPEYYLEGEKRQRILVVVVDASGSMDFEFRNRPRHIWARGVLINLLLASLKEEVRYVVRYFTGYPSERILVDNVDEAKEMIADVIKTGYAKGGTSIRRALEAAVRDVADLRSILPGAADILLITDGDDESITAQNVRKVIGDDIRLHTVCIALSNGKLKNSSHSYYEIT